MSLSEFVALDGPARLGWSSQRDYARAHLGLPWGRFHALRRVGDRLAASPRLREAVLHGRLRWSVLETLSAALGASELEAHLAEFEALDVVQARRRVESLRTVAPSAPGASSAESDPQFARLDVSLPVPVALYVDDTLRLAQALLGSEVPEDQSFSAILAEASTEIEPCDESPNGPEVCAPSTRRTLPRPDCEHRPTPTCPDPERRCRALHRLMRRSLARIHGHRAALEDALLEFHRESAHIPLGYRRFHDFTADALDLPERTTFDLLRNARLRRLDDPVALAVREGRISRVQCALLEAARRLGLPRRAFPAWVEFAAHHTVRALRRALDWARRRFTTEAGAYTNRGCPPPTESQLRTPAHSLEQIAAQPHPPLQVFAAPGPQARRSWTLERDALELYRRLAATLRPTSARGRPRPKWWPLLRIAHLARTSWNQHHARPIAHPHRQVLERDEWTCAAPDCSARRNLHVHHIQFRSRGGEDTPENLSTLCAFHHQRGVHGTPTRLGIEGRATEGRHTLRFRLGPADAPALQLHFVGECRVDR